MSEQGASRVDISLDPRAMHYCAHCGLTMKVRDQLVCHVRDGDLCEPVSRKRRKPRASEHLRSQGDAVKRWPKRVEMCLDECGRLVPCGVIALRSGSRWYVLETKPKKRKKRTKR